MCIECDKPRLIYGKSKLTERQKVQLALLLSSYDFTCGSPLTPPQHSLHGKLVTKMNINCGSPMEIAYYIVLQLAEETSVITVAPLKQRQTWS